MADQDDLAGHIEVLAEQSLHVASHRPFVVSICGTRRVPGAAIVRCNDATSGLDERRHHLAPFPPCLRKPVKEHDRGGALSRRYVMQP